MFYSYLFCQCGSKFFNVLGVVRKLTDHIRCFFQYPSIVSSLSWNLYTLKVPKRQIFDCSDFPDFYTIKSSWVGNLLVKILTYYFNF